MIAHNISPEFEPDALLVHRYKLAGQIGVIIERRPRGKGNEYVWLWGHPSDSIELTRAKAEKELFGFLFGGEDSDMVDGEPG